MKNKKVEQKFGIRKNRKYYDISNKNFEFCELKSGRK